MVVYCIIYIICCILAVFSGFCVVFVCAVLTKYVFKMFSLFGVIACCQVDNLSPCRSLYITGIQISIKMLLQMY